MIPDAMERAGFQAVIRRIGLWRALGVGLRVSRAQSRGEPFAEFPPAEDDRERGTRTQAAGAILLYRALRDAGVAEAIDVVSDAVEAGALVFLGRTLGPIRRAELSSLDDAARDAWVRDRAGRFPNATMVFEQVDAEAVRFRVSACRFVSLCAEVGHPELAPLFCRGDATFFGGVEPNVRLERPHTLAEGGPDCPFGLVWVEDA
jgi:hypothetical protein